MSDPIAEIEKLWSDPKTGLTSFEQFYRTVKERKISITRKKLKDWFDKRTVNQIFKQGKTSFIPITCPEGSQCLQADLMDISRYSSQNRGFKFLLNIIHLDSRYVWSYPLKGKTPNGLVTGLREVLSGIKKLYPEDEILLTTDAGTEFLGAVSTLLKSLKVVHISSDKKHNTSNIERFHRTLWNLIKKLAGARGNLKFIDELPSLISKYNNSYNRAINNKPLNLLGKEVERPEREQIYDIPMGVQVRLARKVQTFDKKSFLPTFSNEIYTVISVRGNRYVVKNEHGVSLKTTYLASELQVIVDSVPEKLNLEKAIKTNARKVTVARRQKQEPAFFQTQTEREYFTPARSKRQPIPTDRFVDRVFDKKGSADKPKVDTPKRKRIPTDKFGYGIDLMETFKLISSP